MKIELIGNNWSFFYKSKSKIDYIIDSINDKKAEMTKALAECKNEEKLLGNFIKGKITAYNEMLDNLSKK